MDGTLAGALWPDERRVWRLMEVVGVVVWMERSEGPGSVVEGVGRGLAVGPGEGVGGKSSLGRGSGVVDFGLVSFDIDSNGRYSWQAHLANIQAQKATAIKL